jgi:hypothetical protein
VLDLQPLAAIATSMAGMAQNSREWDRQVFMTLSPQLVLPNFTIEQCGRSIEGPALDADGTHHKGEEMKSTESTGQAGRSRGRRWWLAFVQRRSERMLDQAKASDALAGKNIARRP